MTTTLVLQSDFEKAILNLALREYAKNHLLQAIEHFKVDTSESLDKARQENKRSEAATAIADRLNINQ
jgi:hypothetical protein